MEGGHALASLGLGLGAVRRADQLIGRFYLDMHPRDGKYNHAAQFSIRTGVAGRQLPIGALVTNFPATGPMNHA